MSAQLAGVAVYGGVLAWLTISLLGTLASGSCVVGWAPWRRPAVVRYTRRDNPVLYWTNVVGAVLVISFGAAFLANRLAPRPPFPLMVPLDPMNRLLGPASGDGLLAP
jgi:hypothetical protein